jgi:hypothetical protein
MILQPNQQWDWAYRNKRAGRRAADEYHPPIPFVRVPGLFLVMFCCGSCMTFELLLTLRLSPRFAELW